jgi:hypothetical protein
MIHSFKKAHQVKAMTIIGFVEIDSEGKKKRHSGQKCAIRASRISDQEMQVPQSDDPSATQAAEEKEPRRNNAVSPVIMLRPLPWLFVTS